MYKTILYRTFAKALKISVILGFFFIVGSIISDMYYDLRDMIKGYRHSDRALGLALESFRYYFITATIGYNLLAIFLKKKYLRVILFIIIGIPAIYLGWFVFEVHPYRVVFEILPISLCSILIPQFIFSRVDILKNWDSYAE